MNNSEISFYVDTMIIESFADQSIVKTAEPGMVMSLIQKVKDYAMSHIDPNDKAGSVLNLLSPGVISMTLGALTVPWLGLLVGLAVSVFHVDVASILRTTYEKVASLVSSNKQISSTQVESAVTDAVKSNPPQIQENKEDASVVDSFLKQESLHTRLHNARMVKLAIIQYSNKEIIKEAQLAQLAPKLIGILVKVITWIFSVILASGGLMIAGDVVNKFVGRPTTPAKLTPPAEPVSNATQTKFKPTSFANDKFDNSNRLQNYTNTKDGIQQMLIDFANDVYSGLQGLEPIIKSTPGFIAITNIIANFNSNAAGDNIVYVPDVFFSKKHIVDKFIDDVAAKS